MTIGWIIIFICIAFLMYLMVKIGELPCDPHHYDFEDYDKEKTDEN